MLTLNWATFKGEVAFSVPVLVQKRNSHSLWLWFQAGASFIHSFTSISFWTLCYVLLTRQWRPRWGIPVSTKDFCLFSFLWCPNRIADKIFLKTLFPPLPLHCQANIHALNITPGHHLLSLFSVQNRSYREGLGSWVEVTTNRGSHEVIFRRGSWA